MVFVCFADLFVMLYRLECVELVGRQGENRTEEVSEQQAVLEGDYFPNSDFPHVSFVNN